MSLYTYMHVYMYMAMCQLSCAQENDHGTLGTPWIVCVLLMPGRSAEMLADISADIFVYTSSDIFLDIPADVYADVSADCL